MTTVNERSASNDARTAREVAVAHTIGRVLCSAPTYLRVAELPSAGSVSHGAASQALNMHMSSRSATRTTVTHGLHTLQTDHVFFPPELHSVLSGIGSRSASGIRRSGSTLAGDGPLSPMDRGTRLALFSKMEDEERLGGAGSAPPSRPISPLSPFGGAEAAAFALGGDAVPGEGAIDEAADLRNDVLDEDDDLPTSDADDGDYGVAYNSDNDDLGGFSDGGGANDDY